MAGRGTKYDTKACGRSRITNGKRLLPTISYKSVWARRFRDLIRMHQADLGGADNCSTAENSIIRRAATLSVELEHLEMLFAGEGAATPDQLLLYSRLANCLRRLLQAIGLQRRPKDVTPTLAEYIAENYPTREAAE